MELGKGVSEEFMGLVPEDERTPSTSDIPASQAELFCEEDSRTPGTQLRNGKVKGGSGLRSRGRKLKNETVKGGSGSRVQAKSQVRSRTPRGDGKTVEEETTLNSPQAREARSKEESALNQIKSVPGKPGIMREKQRNGDPKEHFNQTHQFVHCLIKVSERVKAFMNDKRNLTKGKLRETDFVFRCFLSIKEMLEFYHCSTELAFGTPLASPEVLCIRFRARCCDGMHQDMEACIKKWTEFKRACQVYMVKSLGLEPYSLPAETLRVLQEQMDEDTVTFAQDPEPSVEEWDDMLAEKLKNDNGKICENGKKAGFHPNPQDEETASGGRSGTGSSSVKHDLCEEQGDFPMDGLVDWEGDIE